MRKFFAVFFGVLSVYFALVAFNKHFNPPEDYELSSFQKLDWDSNLQAEARKSDRLIFLVTDKNISKFKSEEIAKLLEKYFIVTKLDPDAYPADYKVLNKIYQNGNSLKKVTFAILTPKAFPIAMGSDQNISEKKLLKLLLVSVNAYKNNKDALWEKAQNAMVSLEKNKDKKFTVVKIPSFKASNSAGLSMIKNLISLHSSGMISGAVLSENFRLALRSTDMFLVMNDSATRSILSEFGNYAIGPNISYKDKILFARAMSECSVMSEFTLRLTDMILSSQPSDFIRDDALKLSLLARAYKISQNKKYFDEAQKLALELETLLSNSKILPASKNKDKSEASALEYALLLRGFADIYSVTNNAQYKQATLNTMEKIQDLFGDAKGGWYENAKASSFSSFYRYYSYADEDYPSYVGEILQVLKVNQPQNTQENTIFKAIVPIHSQLTSSSENYASIKLAL